MTLPPSRAVFLWSAPSFAVLAAVYGSELVDTFRFRAAEVAAVNVPPRPWLALPVLALALAAAGVYAWAVKRARPARFPGYRLLPILMLVTLFADFLVLSESATPVSPADQTAITLSVLQRGLLASTRDTVPTDPDRLRDVVKTLGPPPYYVRRARPPHWNLQVRTDCEGPVGEAPGVEPMTLIYCVASDRKVAWITVVALPAEQRFGPAGMFGRNGEVQMVPVFDPQLLETSDPSPERPEAPETPFDRGRPD